MKICRRLKWMVTIMKLWISFAFLSKTLFMLLLQFQTIFFLICKLYVTEKRTYVNRGCKTLKSSNGLVVNVFNKLPCSQTRILNERYAIFAIVIGLFLPYIGINLFLNEFHGKLMKSCLDLPRNEVDYQNDLKISMLHGSLTLMSIALTLVCDIKVTLG